MEVRRQLLHIAVGAGAIALKWLTWPQAAGIALAAVAFNAFLLPTLLPQVVRRGERTGAFTSGLVLYPMAVLALILIFRHRLDLAATAWVILAAGDGLATLIGVHLPRPALAWNPDKSVVGLLAFVIGGGAAAIGTLWWFSPGADLTWLVTTGLIATVAAGFAESVPIRLDDNITVPVIAAAALWSLTLVSPETWLAAVTTWSPVVLILLAVNGAVAVAGWRAATVTGPGAVIGAALGSLMIVSAGAPGWVMLIAAFLMAAGSTRLGHARKSRAGIAEARGGRRGPGNAIANTGLATWAALVGAGMIDPTLASLALVAALTTAGSDTVASEVGKAFGKTTWLVTTWRRVPAGTSGALSLEGTAAGVAASVVLATIGWGVGLLPPVAIPLVIVGATVASLLEGVLGATLEARGMLTNDVVNFANSAMGAGLTMVTWSLLMR